MNHKGHIEFTPQDAVDPVGPEDPWREPRWYGHDPEEPALCTGLGSESMVMTRSTCPPAAFGSPSTTPILTSSLTHHWFEESQTPCVVSDTIVIPALPRDVPIPCAETELPPTENVNNGSEQKRILGA